MQSNLPVQPLSSSWENGDTMAFLNWSLMFSISNFPCFWFLALCKHCQLYKQNLPLLVHTFPRTLMQLTSMWLLLTAVCFLVQGESGIWTMNVNNTFRQTLAFLSQVIDKNIAVTFNEQKGNYGKKNQHCRHLEMYIEMYIEMYPKYCLFRI